MLRPINIFRGGAGVLAMLTLLGMGCEDGVLLDARVDTHAGPDLSLDLGDSAIHRPDILLSGDLWPDLDARHDETAPPPGPELPGLYHLYPVGMVHGPDDVFAYESCLDGYEYSAIVRLHDQQPCFGGVHVNANAWVSAEPRADSISALMIKGTLVGAELSASWFRSWTPAGWASYSDATSHAAAARYPDGSGAFSLYYETASPPPGYPYEYGQLFLAGSGDAVSGLWRESTVSTYYLAAMGSAAGEATFLRLVGSAGKSYFDMGYGSRSGDLLYAQAVWMLDHEGNWQQTLIEGSPLQYRFNVSTGELREWWAGSEAAPDTTSSFVREIDGSCTPSHDLGTCNCADPGAPCASSLCQSCGPWLPPRSTP